MQFFCEDTQVQQPRIYLALDANMFGTAPEKRLGLGADLAAGELGAVNEGVARGAIDRFCDR
jgi:hypothetical protein